MEASIIYALLTLLVVGMLAVLVVQVRTLRQAKDNAELEYRMRILAAAHEEGETLAETAARVAKTVKISKRKARQRKAARRAK